MLESCDFFLFFLKIRLINGQSEALSHYRRERVLSDSSTDYINFNPLDSLYLSRYQNSCWYRCHTSSLSSPPPPPASFSSFNKYNSLNSSNKVSILNSTPAYDRLKHFTERLLALERKSRQNIIENKYGQKVSLKTDKSIEKVDRSFKTNVDLLYSNVNQQPLDKKCTGLQIPNLMKIQ